MTQNAKTSGRLTDAEMAEADARWAALPGTPPDGYSFIPEEGYTHIAFMTRCENWRSDGMTWFRWTWVDEAPAGAWIEAWKERPQKEAPFNPPYTAEALPEESGGAGAPASPPTPADSDVGPQQNV